MMGAMIVLASVRVLQPLLMNEAPCFPYDQFLTVVQQNLGAVTQTIDTPDFPDVKHIYVVSVRGTKELFMARADCVIVPAAWVDYPPGMRDVDVIRWAVGTPG